MNMKKWIEKNLVIKIQYYGRHGNENFDKKTMQYFSQPATCCYPYYNIIIRGRICGGRDSLALGDLLAGLGEYYNSTALFQIMTCELRDD
ncbi:hypothetical protein QTP88_008957 [Uroleucon formosanum]